MLLAQVDMPHILKDGDFYWVIDSDRVQPEVYVEALGRLKTDTAEEMRFAHATPKSLIAFAQHLVDKTLEHSFKVTGVMVVRQTTLAGYPIESFMIAGVNSGTRVYSGNEGPNVSQPKMIRVNDDCYRWGFQ